MDQEQYRKMKETGETDLDAADQEVEDEVEADDQEVSDETIDEGETESSKIEDSDDDLPEIPDEQKNAFEKRRQRDLKKAEEKLRQELEKEFKSKYGKHEEAVQLLGGDPDKVLQMIRENQMQTEARRVAEANGWDEEQTQYYIEQQKKDQRLKELEVQVEINELRDNPDYPGIQGLKQPIIDKIRASNGALTVADAYWALGGSKRLAQVKLEAEQREIAKRGQGKRTVQSDNPSSQTGEKPLPAHVIKDAEAMGISLEEARRLMSKESPQTIDEYRSRKK